MSPVPLKILDPVGCGIVLSFRPCPARPLTAPTVLSEHLGRKTHGYGVATSISAPSLCVAGPSVSKIEFSAASRANPILNSRALVRVADLEPQRRPCIQRASVSALLTASKNNLAGRLLAECNLLSVLASPGGTYPQPDAPRKGGSHPGGGAAFSI